MVITINEQVFSRDGGWIVTREGIGKISKLSENKKDAMKYTDIIALNNGSSVIIHKYNGQFKNGNKIYVKAHKRVPIIIGTTKITCPIVKNTEFIMDKRDLI